MKNLVLFFALLLPMTSIASDQVDTDQANRESCQSYAYASSTFSTLFCNGGNCSVMISRSPISASGTCSAGSRFNAYGSTFSTTVFGQCRSGFIQLTIPSQMVQFNGTCEKGRLSANPTYTQMQFVSGSCQLNGASMIQIPASNVRFDGQCDPLSSL